MEAPWRRGLKNTHPTRVNKSQQQLEQKTNSTRLPQSREIDGEIQQRTWQRMTASWLGPFLPFWEKREATFLGDDAPPPPPPCSSITYTMFSSASCPCCSRRSEDAQIPIKIPLPYYRPIPLTRTKTSKPLLCC